MYGILRAGVCAMFAMTTGMFGVALILYALWHLALYAKNPDRYDP